MISFVSRIARQIRTRPAFAGLCLVAGGEAAMNAWFGWSSSTVVPLSIVLCAIYMGAEMAKWYSADGFGEAIVERKWVRATSWAVVLCCCLAISVPAHIGFIGMARDAVASKRDTGAERRSSAKQEIERARTELGQIGVVRPAAQIALDQGRQKEGSTAWTRLETERLKSQRARELMDVIGAAESKLAGNEITVGDARVAVLKWVFPDVPDAQVQLALSVAIAIAIELLTTFGFLAVGSGGREQLDLETLLTSGAISHPGSDQVLPFRADVIETARGESIAADDLWAAYEKWARARGKTAMSRGALLRLIEALGVRREGGRFVGVRLKPSFLLVA